MIEPRFLTYRDAARYLSVPVGTLRALVHRKAIPHVRISARSVTFDRAELDQWIEGRARSQSSPRLRPMLPAGYRGRPSLAHESAIDRLPAGAMRHGFAGYLFSHTGVVMAPSRGVVPDAFIVDAGAQRVTIFEIEHEHPISDRKWSAIRLLREGLTAAGWSLRVLAAAPSDRSLTELDADTGCLHLDEIARIIAADHVRFKLP